MYSSGSSAGFPQPTNTWEQNCAARCNARRRRSTGPKPKLLGCESSISRSEELIRALRSKAVPVNTYTARSILCGIMVADGHVGLSSPHLVSRDGAADPSLFMATTAWLAKFLHGMGMSYKAVTGDLMDVPADHAAQQDASIK